MLKPSIMHRIAYPILLLLFLSTFLINASPDVLQPKDVGIPETGAGEEQPEAAVEAITDTVVREGVEVEFSIKPYLASELLEGNYAEVQFKITDTSTGDPVPALQPAVWMDVESENKSVNETAREFSTCKYKIGLFLQGMLTFRPAIDLNSFFILSLNNDTTISVIDPILGIPGQTQTYYMYFLKSPGEDWVLSSDEKQLFITMPKAGQVAVGDTETFKIVDNIDVGSNPVRIALQPNGRYLWVGNDSSNRDESGVTVIDAQGLKVVAQIPTGAGYHEMAFSEDSRYTFVTNRDAGTLSVIDVGKLKKIKDIRTGELPGALAFSGVSRSIYVAHEGDGTIVVVDAERHDVVERIKTRPGLKALRFEPDGRWGFVTNTQEDRVYVVDASNNRIAHTIEVGRAPDQVSFTHTYAYVRSQATAKVSMIPLGSLGNEGRLPVTSFLAGDKPPAASQYRAVADALFSSDAHGNHVLIANPADKTIYYYMEGMGAPMGSFQIYGGQVPRAVRVIDRSLRETEPGVYAARIRIPKSGKYDVAFLLGSPKIIHCFEFTARPNPLLAKDSGIPEIEFLTGERQVAVGENFNLQFKVIDASKDEPIEDLKDIRVQATLAPGAWFERYRAKHIDDGVYEVNLTVPRPGAYYVTLAVPSLKVNADQLPYLVLVAAVEETSK